MHQQLWGYKVEEKLYLGVRKQKKVEYRCFRGINIVGKKKISSYAFQ
jgi:hypothetical protein